MPQRPVTYELRGLAYDILLNHGPKTLNELAQMIGCPKDMLRYAIESTSPFDAVFRKSVEREAVYEAVPAEEIYGGEDFY